MAKIFKYNISAATFNILLAYVAFMLCRVIFFLVNYTTFAPYMSWPLAWQMLQGGMVFDTSALLYLNSLYLVMVLFPLHLKENNLWNTAAKWCYIIPNAAGVASNLVDAVYFQYTGRRTTITVFNEFGNENNLIGIFGVELLRHWYLVVAFVVIVALLWKLFKCPATKPHNITAYYVLQIVSIAALTPLSIIGIRGSATAGTRPITISNANQYVNRAIETSVVLNTPFSIIRTIGKEIFVTPDYMDDQVMRQTYDPQHTSMIAADTANQGKNIVVLIVESLGKEYIGFFNQGVEAGYKGYTPFVDSIASQSLTFVYSYANGRKSMDAMPSILSAIPMFVEPFFLTPASLNDIEGLPSYLSPHGYNSAFFHGGHNISMGFSAFAHAIGYDRYFGLDEYEQDENYGGYSDFDGKWAIWDEPFLQFTADRIAEMKQPFVATVFTATSHHPYKIPAEYEDTFKVENGMEISRCIRYTDHSLRRFFEKASHEPWYDNTIFVIVADHTNESRLPQYTTDLGLFAIPIIFFTPDGSLQPQLRNDVIAQQTDITPTLLGYIGYNVQYVGFGCDLLHEDSADTWAVNYNNGIYQFLQGDYMIQFDGQHVIAVYDFKTDPMLTHNIANDTDVAQMEQRLKAIIQQYMQRMNGNALVIRE